MKKIISILMIFMVILVLFATETYAWGIGDIRDTASDFLTETQGEGEIIDADVIADVSNTIVNVFTTVGIVIAVAIAAILGIQFMVGSVEEKVKAKEALIPFIIGCIVVFGAFGIWRLVVNIGNTI